VVSSSHGIPVSTSHTDKANAGDLAIVQAITPISTGGVLSIVPMRNAITVDSTLPGGVNFENVLLRIFRLGP
jgi:hypothetical protein